MRIKLENLKWKDNWAAPEVQLRKRKKNPFILSLFFCVALVFFWVGWFQLWKGRGCITV